MFTSAPVNSIRSHMVRSAVLLLGLFLISLPSLAQVESSLQSEEETDTNLDMLPEYGIIDAEAPTLRGTQMPGMQGQEEREPVTLTLLPRVGVSLPGVGGFGDIPREIGETFQGETRALAGGLSLGYESRERVLNGRLTGIYRRKTVFTFFSSTSKADLSYLALTADLVVRPIAGGMVQPYLIAGAGAHKLNLYGSGFPNTSSNWEMTAQAGLGMDVRLSESGLSFGLELLDYLSNFDEDGGPAHSPFLTGVVGIPLF